MGQHFVSILTMLHIANKKKTPSFYLEVIICFSRSGETSFHRYITHVWHGVINNLKNISENKKDPEGPFLYNYFFNVQDSYRY